MKERLSMNLKLALSSLFLGILTTFMLWSLRWALESRKKVTFDMPGNVSVLWMFEGPQFTSAANASLAQEELKAYLRDRSLALIVSSCGDGRPEMLVYDPRGLLPWFPRAGPEDPCSRTSVAYLFRGTYSERRWSLSATPPLLPKGVVAASVIDPPRGFGNLQYARRITSDPLPPGVYTLNTIDPAEMRHVLNLLHRMGFIAKRAQTLPLLRYLTLNPLLVITSLFLVLGHVCAVVHWWIYLHGRYHEFGIRSHYGARPADLIRENTVNGLPGLVTGSVVGVILSGFMVAAVGHVPLTLDNSQTLAGAAAVAVVVATVAWSATLYVVICSRSEVNLIA